MENRILRNTQKREADDQIYCFTTVRYYSTMASVRNVSSIRSIRYFHANPRQTGTFYTYRIRNVPKVQQFVTISLQTFQNWTILFLIAAREYRNVEHRNTERTSCARLSVENEIRLSVLIVNHAAS